MKEQNKKTDEQRLLNKISLAELIKIKMKEEIQQEILKIQTSKNKKNEIITDIKKVPQNLIFSKKSIFKVLNKKTKVESFLNGLQVNGFLGLEEELKRELLCGETDAFETEELYVIFQTAEI